jgi:hypothetical protein
MVQQQERHQTIKQRSTYFAKPRVSKKLGSNSSDSEGNINDEGENIEEEENDRNNTMG